MLNYDHLYFSCTSHSMSNSPVEYEVVHACLSCLIENNKMLLVEKKIGKSVFKLLIKLREKSSSVMEYVAACGKDLKSIGVF